MSESNIKERLLGSSSSSSSNQEDREDSIDQNQLQQDYQNLFKDQANQYYNISTNQQQQQQDKLNDQQQNNNNDNLISFAPTVNTANQNSIRRLSSNLSPTNHPSILKKKSQEFHTLQTQAIMMQKSGSIEGGIKLHDGNIKLLPNFSTIEEEQSQVKQTQTPSHNNQVRFGGTSQRKFSQMDEIIKTEKIEGINKESDIQENIEVFKGDPGSVDEEIPQERQEIDYWKGELPLDLFLESTYENGQRTNLDALTVYRPLVDPQLYRSKNGDTYFHFNEKQYDYQASLKEGRKRNMLRKLNDNDGYLGFYSQNKNKDVLKMMICVTMYSESRQFLEQTLYHIFQNQKGFLDIGLKDFQIVVVVIQDGIMKMKEETVDFYSEIEGESRDPQRNLKIRRYEIQKQMDFLKYKNQESVLDANEGLPPTIPKRISLVYQNRLYFVKEKESDKKERPKVYSSNNRAFQRRDGGMTVFSVFKHKNAKKLSSHMWFFEGFCRQFKPKYCALVDVGTLPAADGLLKFYIAMESNSKIGGVCGFLGLEDPPEYREEDKEKQSQPNLGLEEIINNRQKELEKNSLWWNLWKDQKKQKEEKRQLDQLQNEQDNMITEEKVQLKLKKEQHYKTKKRNTTIFSFIFFLPFNLLFLVLQFIYFIVFKCIFGAIFFVLKKIAMGYLSTLASLKKAQLYEYTMAHMLDKNFESCLGFLHVLPGAWSAYRYAALEIKYSQRQNLLQKRYFKQLINPDQLEGNIQEANMFLAEDRILCLGIYCQPDSNFILKFIPDAKAFTDPVDSLEEFMNQRRRWINSTLYALDYVLKHYSHHVKESNHSSWAKQVLLPFNMLFAKIGEINTYFIPAFYFFVAITSSFQLLTPKNSDGWVWHSSNPHYPEQKCVPDMQKPIESLICKGEQKDCYYSCSLSDFPQIFFAFFNLVPAIYIICFLLIVFASLTFRLKRISYISIKEKLCRSLITKDQQDSVNSIQEEINETELAQKDALNRTSKQINKDKNIIEKKQNDLQKHIFTITKQQFNDMVERISQHTIKLSPKEKQFKELYDSSNSQEYANTTFKVLAAVMSFISIIVMLIVFLAIAMNIFNTNFGLVQGFVRLDEWLQIYVIIMVLVNAGSFVILIVVHFLFQPKLVWYIIISYWSYIIYQPIYNFILIIFSFCNIDDVTWGTKGLSSETTSQIFYQGKVKFLVKWFGANALLLLFMIGGNVFSGKIPYLILLIGLYGTSYLAIKTVFAVFNYIKYFLFDKWVALWKVKSAKKKNDVQQQQMEKKFQDFLNKIESSKTKSQNEWGDLYNKQNMSSYDSIQKLVLSSKNVSGYFAAKS